MKPLSLAVVLALLVGVAPAWSASPAEPLDRTITREYADLVPAERLPHAVELALAIQHWSLLERVSPNRWAAHRQVRDKHDVWVEIEIAADQVSVRYQRSENLNDSACYTRSEIRGICSRISKKHSMCDDPEQAPRCIHPAYGEWIDDLLDEIPFAARQIEVISNARRPVGD